MAQALTDAPKDLISKVEAMAEKLDMTCQTLQRNIAAICEQAAKNQSKVLTEVLGTNRNMSF